MQTFHFFRLSLIIFTSIFYYFIGSIALDKANEQLFYQGVDTCIVRFGRVDTPRVRNVDGKKMSIDYACQVIIWILRQPHRVKELTVCP